MKTYSTLLLFILLGIFTSCQQNNDPNTLPPTPNDYYITFELDGTPMEFRTTSPQVSVSNGSGSGFRGVSCDIIPNVFSTPRETITINIDMQKDSIVYSDLKALEGQTLNVCQQRGTSACNYPIAVTLSYDKDTELWGTYADNNPAGVQGITITSVEPSDNVSLTGNKLADITGEFNLVLDVFNNGTTTLQTASNGKFRLLFTENRD